MQSAELYSTWVEVDLRAIEANVRWFCDHVRTIKEHQTGSRVMAVVKANAYGHGAVPVARAALHGGATWLGVARIEEALELRRAGLDCPLLLLGYTPPAHMEDAIANQVSMTVWDAAQIKAAAGAAREVGRSAYLHLKVDTGMSRLGTQPQQALALAGDLAGSKDVIFEGIFTHFARADEESSGPSEAQEQRFRQVLADLEEAGLRPPLVHAANSAASLTRPGAYFDLVRIGIALYGLHPSRACQLPSAFRPALAWKTILSQVKVLPPGRGVSYGHIYTTTAEERIGTLPVGYADGFRRTLGNQVLVAGRRAPLVGRVCMDQVTVQLDAVPEARPGDEVVLIGAQGEERITAEEVADRWGTINYEVVCGIGSRVPRLHQ
jgi:alanine racemase